MKTLFTFFLIGFVSMAQAQFIDGYKLIGGGISFSHNKTDAFYSHQDGYKNFGVSFNPNYQTIVNNNTILGLGINGTLAHSSFQDTAFSSTAAIGINGLFQKQAWLGKRIYVFANASPSINYAWRRDDKWAGSTNGNGRSQLLISNISVSPGLGFRLTKRLSAEVALNQIANISYTWAKNETFVKELPAVKTNNFNFNSNLSQGLLNNLGFSFRWMMKNKKS